VRHLPDRELVSSVRFSHRVLGAPQLVQPQDGGTLPVGGAAIEWAPVPRAVDYEVIVTRDDAARILDVTLSPDRTALTVPAGFLDPGAGYGIEVHASARSGNRIFTEVHVTAT
jgi:hypothetical protein